MFIGIQLVKKRDRNLRFIPNPYRSDFIEYKDKLANQITTLVSNFICNILAENKITEIKLEGDKIKHSISDLLNNIAENENVQRASEINDEDDDIEMFY